MLEKRSNPSTPEEKKPLSIIPMDSVKIAPVQWLWYPYIPFGKVTILQGDPGCGKTMLALNLAARISNGEALPFCNTALPPMPVLYQTAEDGIDDTIKPRLVEARANCKNILFIDECSDPLCFTDERIEAAIRQVGAKLLILDPMSAYIGDVSMNQANEVRSSFRPLYEVASATGCAILIVAHMNKLLGTSALYRTNGSIDIAGSVRSILSVGKRKGAKTERIMVHIKSNLAAVGPAMIYELTDKIEWTRQEDVNPDELFSLFGSDRKTKRSQAEDELLRLLSAGDKPATAIEQHFQKQGISYRTVTEAKKSLRILSYRKGNQSMWSLPPELRNKEDCTGGIEDELPF
ncbi:MAG: AAA family ATPase [Firmicutes bacterium]|nr:AAA family ATPase [Bacillota bacterium]